MNRLLPKFRNGEYVFCSFADWNYTRLAELKPLATMQEEEGITMVVPKETADKNRLPYTTVFQCITLGIHSSLEAVGLTAKFSARLARQGISANVIAGYHHDHVLVKSTDAKTALEALKELSW